MKENNKGITLIALVVTIVVLLILAGITITYVMENNGVFSMAQNAKIQTDIAKAREKLEIVLGGAQIEKYTNHQYNENEFLDKYILDQIKDSNIIGDTAIVDGYAFELDRSVPKIGHYIGKVEDLVFPTVKATATLANDKRTAIITITALETTNGINRIEIWQFGEKISEIPCNNQKTEVTKEFEAKKNGKYIIKAYGNLCASTTITVEGILRFIKFEPDGNTSWKKEHSAKLTIEETDDKVTKTKYLWTDSTIEPEDNQFPESQIFHSGDVITQNELTGSHYLWVLLETQSGKKVKVKSDIFNFDNEAPTIVDFVAEESSESELKLKVTVEDELSGWNSYEFFIDGISKGKVEIPPTTEQSQKVEIYTEYEGTEHTCEVIVSDQCGNETRMTIKSTPKMYTWEKWNAVFTKYNQVSTSMSSTKIKGGNISNVYEYYNFSSSTGRFSGVGQPGTHSGGSVWYSVSSTSVTAYQFLRVEDVTYYVYARTKYTSVGDPSSAQKGSTSYDPVSSTDPNAYPQNGVKDNYYYVLIEE